MSLSEAQIQRYSRHILLPDVGGVGQERLLEAAVELELGPGKDANVVALAYLAAAGVGRILVTGDRDAVVTDAELPGGILYGAADVGATRMGAVRRRVAAINPEVNVTHSSPGTAALRLDAAPARDPVDALISGGAAALEILMKLVTRP